MNRKSGSWILLWILLWMVIFGFTAQTALAEHLSSAHSVSLWAGYYLPQDAKFQKIYKDNGSGAGFIEFSRTWPNQIETTVGLGGSYFNGHTLNRDNTPSKDRVGMTLAAGYIQAAYLFRYSQGQRLVPYLGGGLDVWGYQEKKEGVSGTEGCKYGYHGLAGVRFLLDWLDPKAARESLRDYSIKNTYLILEARWLQVDNFGEHKLDLSGPLYRLGVLLEF